MKTRLAALLLALLCLVLPAQAQDATFPPPPPVPTETPTPSPTIPPTLAPTIAVTTEGFVYSAGAEVIFPAGIRFTTIVLQRLPDIASVELRIEPEVGAAQTIDIDLEEALVTDQPNVELAYVWTLTADNAPPLFSEIRYVWTVRNIADEVYTGEGIFQFTDSRILWQSRTDEGRRFDLTLPTDMNLSQLGRSLDAVYALMEANTDQSPTLNLIFYDNSVNLNNCVANDEGEQVAIGAVSGVAIPCTDPELASTIITDSGFSIVRGSRAFVNAQDAISNHLFDVFYAPLWSDQAVPAWFVSGLRRLYAPTAKDALLAPALSAARGSNLFSLDEMAASPQDAALLNRWEAQAYSMVLYIADSFGLPALYELARMAGSASLDDAYQSVTGVTLDSLLPRLRDWLVSPNANAAFRVLLYGAPTAIPSPSATLTPFPPTRTLRPQPSATATATITLTSTRRPTHTPTPSVTPRPPGSLDTATPIPAQTQPPLIESSSRSSILAVLVIILAVLVIAFARVGNR
ncbi:MAG: hypothetical protein IT320_01995 [Anaerolineae bacterium]|nr:hypothetical protein [Anaerolineae bacterium]